MDADQLLAGPRGRGLLLALCDSQDVRELVMRADAAARPRGSSATFGWLAYSDAPTGLARIPWVRQRRAAKEFRRQLSRPVQPGEFAAAVGACAPSGVLEDAGLIEALARTVDTAKYWQEPDGVEALLAAPEVVEVLRPLAQRVATAVRWDAPVASRQWFLEREVDGVPARARRTPAEVLVDDTAAGNWWTIPPHELPFTTGALPGFPDVPAGLALVEDSLGAMRARATPVTPPSSNVLELTCAADFVRLATDFPRRVSQHSRETWRLTTGRDGDWISPDWPRIAERWDGVHLSYSAYLEGATRALDCGDGLATIIAGWSPDVTYWFIPAPASGPSVQWRHGDQLGWRAQP